MAARLVGTRAIIVPTRRPGEDETRSDGAGRPRGESLEGRRVCRRGEQTRRRIACWPINWWVTPNVRGPSYVARSRARDPPARGAAARPRRGRDGVEANTLD